MDVLHTAIWVSDVEEMREFYCGTLGLEFSREFEGDDGVRNYFVAGESDTELQFKYDGDREIEPSGFDHTAVAVEDIDAVIDELPADRVNQGATEVEGEELRIAFVEDPEGYGVELIEGL